MTEPSVQSSEPSPSHRRRRRWIVIGLLGGFVLLVGLLPFVGTIAVDRGYLATTRRYGYGYAMYRAHEGSTLWHTDRLYAVVLWKAEQPPDFSKGVTINGHYPVWPSQKVVRGDNAVYALQADFTLKRIPLSAMQMDRVSILIEEAKRDSRFRPDDLWQTHVEPELRIVEPKQKEQASVTEPADAPAGTE